MATRGSNYSTVGSLLKCFTFYVRGALRKDGASSDTIKFDTSPEGIKGAVDEFFKRYSRMIVQQSLPYLNSTNFKKPVKPSKANANIEKIKEYMNDKAREAVEKLSDSDPNALAQISSDLAFLCYVSHREKTKIESRGYSNAAIDFRIPQLTSDDGQKHSHITMLVQFLWTVTKSNKIESTSKISYSCDGSRYRSGHAREYSSWYDLLSNCHYDFSTYRKIVDAETDEISKLEFSSIDHKYRGVFAGNRFGV